VWTSCESAGHETARNFLLGDGSRPWTPNEVFVDVNKNH
jgi:hypothetical protein